MNVPDWVWFGLAEGALYACFVWVIRSELRRAREDYDERWGDKAAAKRAALEDE